MKHWKGCNELTDSAGCYIPFSNLWVISWCINKKCTHCTCSWTSTLGISSLLWQSWLFAVDHFKIRFPYNILEKSQSGKTRITKRVWASFILISCRRLNYNIQCINTCYTIYSICIITVFLSFTQKTIVFYVIFKFPVITILEAVQEQNKSFT